MYSTPRFLNITFSHISNFQHSFYTHIPPIYCGLSRQMALISATGSLGQRSDRLSQVNTDSWQTGVETNYHPVFILAAANTRTKHTLNPVTR